MFRLVKEKSGSKLSNYRIVFFQKIVFENIKCYEGHSMIERRNLRFIFFKKKRKYSFKTGKKIYFE